MLHKGFRDTSYWSKKAGDKVLVSNASISLVIHTSTLSDQDWNFNPESITIHVRMEAYRLVTIVSWASHAKHCFICVIFRTLFKSAQYKYVCRDINYKSKIFLLESCFILMLSCILFRQDPTNNICVCACVCVAEWM